jgi:hypothetical protein
MSGNTNNCPGSLHSKTNNQQRYPPPHAVGHIPIEGIQHMESNAHQIVPEKIRPWAMGLRVMQLKTIGRGRGGHPWWAQPQFVMIK